MGWYFLSFTKLPEDASARFKNLGVIATTHTITEPEEDDGLVFETENYRAVLDLLGKQNEEFVEKPTEQPGVIQLLSTGPRQLARRVIPTRRRIPRAGADELVEVLRSGYSAERQKDLETRARVLKEVTVLERHLATELTKLQELDLRLAVLTEVDAEAEKIVRAEYARLMNDPCVEKAELTDDELIVITKKLVFPAVAGGIATGTLVLSIGLFDGQITGRIKDIEPKNAGYDKVSEKGLVYLGTLREQIVRYIGRREFGIAVKLILDNLTRQLATPTEVLKKD